jgi:hypothetical protein
MRLMLPELRNLSAIEGKNACAMDRYLNRSLGNAGYR